MTTAIISQAPAGSLRQYLSELRNTARSVFEAMYATQGLHFVAEEKHEVSTARAKAKGRRQLFALAKQYDSFSPSLSAELRAIAARD